MSSFSTSFGIPTSGTTSGGVSYTTSFADPYWYFGLPVISAATAAPAPFSPAAVAASTGVNPVETSYALYGHTIPLTVFGVGRIGGEIIAGPWVANGLASFIISFGVPADPSGTRDIREIAFDSEVVWSTNGTTGITTSAGGTFSTEAFTFRFYQGTLTQGADALETANFGANAVAYRPQILLVFENLPLANTKFRKIPYVAAVIGDGSGDDVNLGEAFERLAYSPWVGYTPSQFETSGITDGLVSGGLIFAQDTEFLQAMQLFGRFYPSWDILQTDKLRIVDRGSNLSPDITLDKTRMMDKIAITRAEPNSVPRKLILSTIDPDADYTIVPSTAQRPLVPVAVSTSVATESVYLPAIMDASTRTAVVTYTKYHEEQARKTIAFTAMAYGLEIEPGALVQIDGLGADFQTETFKIVQTLHGANYVVECTAQSMLRCTSDNSDTHLGNVVLLLGFEGVDASTGSPGMTDESPSHHGTGSVGGNAQVDTAQFKFGAAAYLSDGTGDGLHFPPSTDWQIAPAAGDMFTVEAFVRPNTTNEANRVIVGQGGVTGENAWLFWCNTAGNGELSFWGTTTTGAVFDWPKAESSGISWVSGQWYHVAADRDATNKLRVYRDGMMVASVNTGAVGMPDASSNGATLGVGCDSNPVISRSWSGWIDEVRITKGVARYASDAGFTVPAAAFPRP